MKRDRQKSKVYAWEDKYIAPFDKSNVPFDNIDGIVKYIWEQEGLKYPPEVKKIDVRKHALGTGCRTAVRFQENTPTWLILHELAHAMTSTVYNESNRHGALFLGIYIQLASRYLKLDFTALVDSAIACGLRVDAEARPVFL